MAFTLARKEISFALRIDRNDFGNRSLRKLQAVWENSFIYEWIICKDDTILIYSGRSSRKYFFSFQNFNGIRQLNSIWSSVNELHSKYIVGALYRSFSDFFSHKTEFQFFFVRSEHIKFNSNESISVGFFSKITRINCNFFEHSFSTLTVMIWAFSHIHNKLESKLFILNQFMRNSN